MSYLRWHSNKYLIILITCVTREYYSSPPHFYPTPDKVGTFGCTVNYKLCMFLKVRFGPEVSLVALHLLAMCFTSEPHTQPPYKFFVYRIMYFSFIPFAMLTLVF